MIVGFWLVSQAMGYRYNPALGRLQKTGMLIISNAPKESQLKLDNRTYTLKTTTRLPNLLPGTYHLTISKNNYTPWEDTVTVQPGFVVNLNDISLFLARPIVLPEQKKYADLVPFYQTNDNRLRLDDNELWMGTELISRFSQPLDNALLLADGRHLVYLRGREVHILETNGRHDQLLYTRGSVEPKPLVLIEGVVVFADTGGVTALQIQ